MKLSKKLLAGLLATSMLATGSTAFAAVTLGEGKGTLAETEAGSNLYNGSGTMTVDSIGDAPKHNVTGTATFKDVVTIDITWGALTYSFERTWNATDKKWNEAVWKTTDGSGKISVENKSARAYDVTLQFEATKLVGDYAADGTKVDYSGVGGKFYKDQVLVESDTTKTGTDGEPNKEQSTLALGAINQTNRTMTSYLWLSGNPKNNSEDKSSVAGKFGFNDKGVAENSETFGKVIATFAEHTSSTEQGGI